MEAASTLIVAIEEYKFHPSLPELGAAANSLANNLRSRGFADVNPSIREGGDVKLLYSVAKDLFAKARNDQTIVLFWSGHGLRESSRFYLAAHDSPTFGLDGFNAVDPNLLAAAAARSVAKRILIFIDACYSGASIGGLIMEVSNVLAEMAPEISDNRGIAIIASAHPSQKAQAGVMPWLLNDVLVGANRSRRWTDSDRFIDGDRLIATLKDEIRRRGVDQAIVPAAFGETIELIPNPRYRAGLPAENVEERTWRLMSADAGFHFDLSSRGIEVREQGFFFSGRKRLLQSLVEWLSSDLYGVRVITGPPGAGKSAVVGRLATMSDPQFRQAAIDAGAIQGDEADLPSVGSIRVAVHAKGKGLEEVVDIIAAAFGLRAATTNKVTADELVDALSAYSEDFCLIIDALDEASTGQSAVIASSLILPLGQTKHAKILVGCRRSLDGMVLPSGIDRHHRLYAAFGSRVIIDDLDDEKDSLSDIAGYVSMRLRNSKRHRRTDPIKIEKVALRVAQRACGGFLYARLVSRTLQDMDNLDGDLPSNALEAFEQDLHIRFAGRQKRINDLLGALAWAEGKGVTRRVWPLLAAATAVTSEAFDDDDISWILENVGWHVIEAEEEGQAVYRLSHQALADHFLVASSEANTQSRITRMLSKDIKGLEWIRCDNYLKRHLPEHAAKARDFGEMIFDAGFLAVADKTRLLQSLWCAAEGPARRCADIYNRFVDAPTSEDAVERMGAIHLIALKEDDIIAPLIAHWPGWTGHWANVRRSTPHRVIGRHDGKISSIAYRDMQQASLLVSGSWDGTVRLWHASTGEPLHKPLIGSLGWVDSVCLVRTGHIDVVVAGNENGTLSRWLVETGKAVGRPVLAHDGPVLALSTLNERLDNTVVSVGEDRAVCHWDIDSGKLKAPLVAGHRMAIHSVVTGIVDEIHITVSGGLDGMIRVWNSASGLPISDPLDGHFGVVNAICLGRIGADPIIVSAGDDRGFIRWDAKTYKRIGRWTVAHAARINALAFATIDDKDIIVTCSDDGSIKRWDASSGLPIGDPLDGHLGPVHALTIGSIDSRPTVFSGSADHTIRSWDIVSAASQQSAGEYIWEVSLSAVRKGLVASIAGPNREVRIWRMDTGQPIQAGSLTNIKNVTVARFATLSGEVVLLTVVEATIICWNTTTWDKIGATIELPKGVKITDADVGTTADGRPILLCIGGTSLYRFDLNSGGLIRSSKRSGQLEKTPMETAAPLFMAISAEKIGDTLVLVSQNANYQLQFWDAISGAQVQFDIEVVDRKFNIGGKARTAACTLIYLGVQFEPTGWLSRWSDRDRVIVRNDRAMELVRSVSGNPFMVACNKGVLSCLLPTKFKSDEFMEVDLGENITALAADDEGHVLVGTARGLMFFKISFDNM